MLSKFLLLLATLISILTITIPKASADDTTSTTLSPTPVPNLNSCNLTAYQEWRFLEFEAFNTQIVLPQTNERWWDITNYAAATLQGAVGAYTLNNGEGMRIMTQRCRGYLTNLKIGFSGGFGVIPEQAVKDVMCMDYCVISDALHVEAMEYSGCTCLDLSTPRDAVTYSRVGDYCLESSGRMMCDVIGRCGVWECELGDFECSRAEYDTKEVPLRGKGCSSAEHVKVGLGLFVALVFGNLVFLGV